MTARLFGITSSRQHEFELHNPALSEELRIRDILAGVGVMTSGAFVAAYELSGLYSYYHTEEQRNRAKESLEAVLRSMPDGKLNLLPFDALRDSDGKFVLESHVVTYAPSATVLYLLREARSSNRATRDFLGVGGVVYPNPDEGGSTGSMAPKANIVADLFGLDAVVFPDLPGSKQEVVEAAGIIRGSNQLILERDATEVAFKALPLSEFRIIHLAVHGVANADFPDRAALVLGSSASSGEDGLLQVREIRDLSLRADLVTLSAMRHGLRTVARPGGNHHPRTRLSAGGCKSRHREPLAGRRYVHDRPHETYVSTYPKALTKGRRYDSQSSICLINSAIRRSQCIGLGLRWWAMAQWRSSNEVIISSQVSSCPIDIMLMMFMWSYRQAVNQLNRDGSAAPYRFRSTNLPNHHMGSTDHPDRMDSTLSLLSPGI